MAQIIDEFVFVFATDLGLGILSTMLAVASAALSSVTSARRWVASRQPGTFSEDSLKSASRAAGVLSLMSLVAGISALFLAAGPAVAIGATVIILIVLAAVLAGMILR